MAKTIAVFGQRPSDLGGFRDHNPFRLFARERFRRFLRAECTEDTKILILGDLGAGQWFAEVAREENQPYYLVVRPEADAKWSATQRAKMAELAATAEDVIESPEPETFLSSYLLSATTCRLAFIAVERNKVAGRVAVEARRLQKEGIPIIAVYPDEMTTPYLVLGALEEVRGAIPDGLLRVVEGAKLQLDCLIAQGMRPKPLERARRRRQELAVLEATLRAFLCRGDIDIAQPCQESREDVAAACGVPVDWVPEDFADLDEDALVAAVEAARDREARLQASPLFALGLKRRRR